MLNIFEIKPKVKVECHKCGYIWRSKSSFVKVSCPKCGAKTLRIKPIKVPSEQEEVEFKG